MSTAEVKQMIIEQPEGEKKDLKLKDNFSKNFEKPENRVKLSKAVNEKFKWITPEENDTMKNGVEKTIKSTEFQNKFEEVLKIPKSDWMKKWALSQEQRGMVAVLYLYAGLTRGDKSNPEDVATIYNRLKQLWNTPKLERSAAPVVVNQKEKQEQSAQSIRNITTPEKRTNAVAMRSFSDTTGEISNIIKSYDNLDSTYDKVLSLEKKINQNNWEIRKLESKLTKTTETQKELNTMISDIQKENRAPNQKEQIAIRDKNNLLKTYIKDSVSIRNSIATIRAENEQLIAQNVWLISEFKQWLEQLQVTYRSDKNTFEKNISEIKEGEVNQRNTDLLTKQQILLKTINTNLPKINNLLWEKWPITTYLAQFNKNQEVEKITPQSKLVADNQSKAQETTTNTKKDLIEQGKV